MTVGINIFRLKYILNLHIHTQACKDSRCQMTVLYTYEYDAPHGRYHNRSVLCLNVMGVAAAGRPR